MPKAALIACLFAFVYQASCASAAVPQPRVHVGFDDGLQAHFVQEGVARLPRPPSGAAAVDTDLFFARVPGRVGKAARADQMPLNYEVHGAASAEHGTVMAWVRPDWDVSADPEGLHIAFDLPRFGRLYRYPGQNYWTFALWYHHVDEKHDYACTAPCAAMRRGAWLHIAVTWSMEERRRRIYLDGVEAAASPIKRGPAEVTGFGLGRFGGAIDEVYVFDQRLPAAAVRAAVSAGRTGSHACALPPVPGRARLTSIPRTEGAPPGWVRWDFEGAEQRDNGMRAEVVLNGVWRCQQTSDMPAPPVDAAWNYRNVPSERSGFPIWNAARGVVAGESDQWCWYEREFTLPDGWPGRRVELDIERLDQGGAVYLDGELKSSVPSLNAGVTLTLDRRGGRVGARTVSIRTKGLPGDVWLRSAPSRDRIADVWLKASVRRRGLELDADLRSPGGRRLRVKVRDAGGTQVVNEFSVPVDGRAGLQHVSATAPWADAVLWSPEGPHLYEFEAELLAQDGRVLDRTLPCTFGFREFSIGQGDFLLNGRPYHLYGHSHPHFRRASEYGVPDYIEYQMRRWQECGLNFLYLWYSLSLPDYAHVFPTADRLGMLVGVFTLPGLSVPTPVLDTPAFRTAYRDTVARWLRRYRHSPSLVLFLASGGAHVFDFCPAKIGDEFRPEQAYPEWQDWRRLTMAMETMAELDPTRPTFPHSAGNFGSVRSTMGYLGFGVDLQERANWPLRWAQSRRKPMFISEFGLPLCMSWTSRPLTARRFQGKGKQTFAAEYAAMYFGDEAYAWGEDEWVDALHRANAGINGNETGLRLRAEFARDTLRAWRTYGISYCFHGEVPGFYAGEKPKFVTERLDPRRSGASPEPGVVCRMLQCAEERSELGEAVKAAQQPLLVYLGGPNGQFARRDHCWYADAVLGKALVTVNDTTVDVVVSARWRLQDGLGQTVREGVMRPILVKSGMRSTSDRVLSLRVPSVKRRTDFRLVIEPRSEGDALPVHETAVTVFPPAPRPPADAGTKVVWFGPAGSPAVHARWGGRALARGEDLREDAAAGSLLIVGRQAVSDPDRVTELRGSRFDEAFRAGLRVLVLEQSPGAWEGPVLGLRLRETSTRRAFVRAAGHPAFDGLEQGDFAFWRGESDLLAPYPAPGECPKSKYAYPERFWRWGNDNIVATYVIEKPQVGAARALLDCGFDLSETPLLEVCRGKGRAVFCQLDVTNRYGTAPVATRVLDNLVRYLLTAPGPREAVDLRSLASRQAGASAARAELVRSTVPAGLLFWGIDNGALFFRRRLSVPVLEAGSPTPLFAAVDAGRRVGLCSLSTATLPSPWLRAKRDRIEAALQINAGGTSEHGPGTDTMEGMLYPTEWRRVETMPEPFDPYGYWRW